MNNVKDATALDCHPQQQQETQPLSKRLDLTWIINLSPKIKQLPANSRLMVDPMLLYPGTQIYSGYIKNKYILSSQKDLSIDPELNSICEDYKTGKHYEIAIRRTICKMMNGNYPTDIVSLAEREMSLLGVSANITLFRQDNTRDPRGKLACPANFRLAEALAAVIWERIISRCDNHYESMKTDSIIVSI